MVNIINFYKSLSDTSRLRIVNALRLGSFNVQELTELLELGQSTVSHHLKVLSQVEIVNQNKEGTWVFYTLNHLNNFIEETINFNFKKLESLASHNLKEVFKSDKDKIKLLQDKRRATTKEFFENSAKDWNSLRKETIPFNNDECLKVLANSINPSNTLLELGTGAGALLQQILPRTGKTIAVDYSEAMLSKCKDSLSEEKLKSVDLRLGYLEHLPLADNSVDEAVAFMVFHYLDELEEVFSSCNRVLKPGGELKIIDLKKHENEHLRERYLHKWLGFDEKFLCNLAKKTGFLEISFSSLKESDQAFLFKCKKRETHNE